MLCQFLVLVVKRFWFNFGSNMYLRDHYYDRKKKIQSSVWWVHDHYYDRKKKIQLSVWRVVLLCQFLVLAGNWQFFCCGGKVLLPPEKKDTVVCLGGAGSLLRPKKKRYSCLSGGCVIIITTGKKRYSRLSGRLCCCVSFWFWREIGSYFVVAGNFYHDRKKKKIQSSVCWVHGSGDSDRKKKDTVLCLAGCAVVSVFGSGGKLAFFV